MSLSRCSAENECVVVVSRAAAKKYAHEFTDLARHMCHLLLF